MLVGAVAGLNALSQRGPEAQTAYRTTAPNWLAQLAAGLGFTLGRGNKAASLGATSLEGWIKYRVLDKQGNQMLDAQGRDLAGVDYVAGTGQWEYLQTGVRVPDNGVIEVMAGTSGSGEAVYFDNLRVEQTGGLIVQEQHQYAYGAPLPGLSYVVGNRRYRYGYQGQYAEHDSLTGFESFELRLYNNRVGRWMNYDPKGQFDSPYIGMANNPVSQIDPDGGRVPLPKFRPSGYGLHAAKGISNALRLSLQTASSVTRTFSRQQVGLSRIAASDFHFFDRSHEDAAYDYMNIKGTHSKKEIAAYLVSDAKTGEEGVLILPWISNSYGTSKPDINLSVSSKTIHDYKGRVFNILVSVHLHPIAEHGTLSSPADRKTLKSIDIPGYILNRSFIYKIDLNEGIGEQSPGPTEIQLPSPAMRQRGMNRPSLFPPTK
ncbi:MAG: RHS repeat domain-containing protein [Janthinobacterium lividum]